MKMLQQPLAGVFLLKQIRIVRRQAHAAKLVIMLGEKLIERCVLVRKHTFRRMELADLPQQRFAVLNLGDEKFPGGDVSNGEAVLFSADDGDDVVRRLLEDVVLEDHPRRDDADDLAAHESLDGFGIFCLLTDGNFFAEGDQLFDVDLGRMKRHTTHRHLNVVPAVARCQREAEQLAGFFGVLVEHFVEIAETVKEDHVFVLILDLLVLNKHRGVS